MIIRPSKSRTEFERILRKIKINVKQPVSLVIDYVVDEVLPKYKEKQIQIEIWAKFFKSKKSFLYFYYLSIRKKYSKKVLYKKLKTIAKRIDIKSNEKICEVGWNVNNQFVLRFWNKDQLKKLYIDSLNEVQRYINNGFAHIELTKGFTLVSYPTGLVSEVNSEVTSKKRGNINRRFGFSSLDEDGYQFGIYNENKKLIST
jgi:hypothetical protein